MSYTLTPEQVAILEHHVSLGEYPSKEAALKEAFRRFKKMLAEETNQNATHGSSVER
jgi:Arc/MetJ-type ribon-helix-helix transcriptional regulator